jgi:hypothetical protein
VTDIKNLPVPTKRGRLSSIDDQKSIKARLACHEWQHGSHIDSLPKQPSGTVLTAEEMKIIARQQYEQNLRAAAFRKFVEQTKLPKSHKLQ